MTKEKKVYMMSPNHKLKSEKTSPSSCILIEKPEPGSLNLEVRVGEFHRGASH